MKIIKAGYEMMTPINAQDIYRKIELVGRTCYKSEDKITDKSAERFVRALATHKHEAMLEHESISVRFTVDRGVSHELVRHRLASFAQESTRYCRYSDDKFGKEITVIEPCVFNTLSESDKEICRRALHTFDLNDKEVNDFLSGGGITDLHRSYARWYDSCEFAEHTYLTLLDNGLTPQMARSVLPTSLKTEVVVTANIREWRHILNLRAAGTTGAPHPQMAEVMVPLLKELQEKLPALFDDIQIAE